MVAKVPGNESSRERKLARTFVPGSERAGERTGQGPIGRLAPRNELARERKGSVPSRDNANVVSLVLSLVICLCNSYS